MFSSYRSVSRAFITAHGSVAPSAQPLRSIVVLMFDDETVVAWRAMPYRATVVADDGSEIGTAESLLADDEEDIFHGIVVKRGRGGAAFEIPAARIVKITEKHVVTDLATDEANAL